MFFFVPYPIFVLLQNSPPECDSFGHICQYPPIKHRTSSTVNCSYICHIGASSKQAPNSSFYKSLFPVTLKPTESGRYPITNRWFLDRPIQQKKAIPAKFVQPNIGNGAWPAPGQYWSYLKFIIWIDHSFLLPTSMLSSPSSLLEPRLAIVYILSLIHISEPTRPY